MFRGRGGQSGDAFVFYPTPFKNSRAPPYYAASAVLCYLLKHDSALCSTPFLSALPQPPRDLHHPDVCFYGRMIPPGRRRRRRRAITCVVALLLLSVPPGATESNVLEHVHSSKRGSSRTAALIAGPGAGTRAWSSESALPWRRFLRGGQGVWSSRSSERRHVIANARKDHDHAVAGEASASAAAAGSSTSGSIDIKAEPPWSGGTAVEGRGGGSVGSSKHQDPGVHSLVDLVKLLEVSENPLWELVRFEVQLYSK